jgi:uncharacterized membrane protein
METLRIELRRAGVSRVSEATIPLVARILSSNGYSSDLLASDRLTDADCAKQLIKARLDEKFGADVPIQWIDATRALSPDEQAAAAECGGLVEAN